MKWNDWNLIAFGFVMGSVSAGTLEASLNSKVFVGNDGRLQWETLVTGITALLAALLTIMFLNRQIRQTAILAKDQRQRQARSARAVLPFALSELEQYTRVCIKGLYDLRPYFQSADPLDLSQINKCLSAWPSPRLPEDVLSVFKECVEFSDKAPALAASTLIGKLQVQKSRLTEYASRLRLQHFLPPSTIDLAIGDAAEVFARGSRLFPFARGYTVPAFDVSRDDVYKALSDAGCFDSYEEIGVLADRWERESIWLD
jgi:hypothetical protein